MKEESENYLFHIGSKHRSGRYPEGSGEEPYQRCSPFLHRVNELKAKGMKDKEIADVFGVSRDRYQSLYTVELAEQKARDRSFALRLRDKGMSLTAIGQRMGGRNESSVRDMLKEATKKRGQVLNETADTLRKHVNEKDYVDVGLGVERYLSISRSRLKAALTILEKEGYSVHNIPHIQVGTGKNTYIATLVKPGVTWVDAAKNKHLLKPIMGYTDGEGKSQLGIRPITHIDSKTIKIRYHEDGGTAKDGLIELRRGVPELSLGKAKYAQVRIGVDGTHYLKGMAVYNDDMPKGINIIYNTNKKKGTPGKATEPNQEQVFKDLKRIKLGDKAGQVDEDNPFGSSIRQKSYFDSKGNEKTSALNICNEEGSWQGWSKSISSQMLSKQDSSLAKKQLDISYNIKKNEYEDICKLTNPTVKKFLLKKFADKCDSSAVDLQATALPRQATHAILPLATIKENHIYAPNYRHGENVVLIRYPHGGKFEIPELKVNNKNREARGIIGKALDAVGIHHKVAEKLSGADFDGDTVLVIPNPKGTIKSEKALQGLKDFDPKISYPKVPGMTVMTKAGKGKQMGDISNLITDMTIKGATHTELAAAVRHSMVVIDAEKHKLNYKLSYLDNGIAALKTRYQGSARAGASTLISRASSQASPLNRKEFIDPATGQKKYVYPGETYSTPKGGVRVYKGDSFINSKGEREQRKLKSTKMYETDDARKLSSGTQMENIYATYANRMKALANDARKNDLASPTIKVNKQATKTYAKEVDSLKGKVNIALMNKPLERQAHVIARQVIAIKKAENPGLKDDKDLLKKVKNQALMEARDRMHATIGKRESIELTDREWQAIQSGAISHNVLTQILNNTDTKVVQKLATPRATNELPAAKVSRIKNMIANGYNQAEIADALGISTSTVTKYM